MSLEKAIKHKKEKRKPYYDCRNFDWTCRNHGACSYCRDNRTFFHKKALPLEEDDVKFEDNSKVLKMLNQAEKLEYFE